MESTGSPRRPDANITAPPDRSPPWRRRSPPPSDAWTTPANTTRPSSQQAATVAYDQANEWRTERIDQLRLQLEQQWAAAVVSAASDSHPLAYGLEHLRAVREHLVTQILTQSAPTPAGVGDPQLALQDLHQAIDAHTAEILARHLMDFHAQLEIERWEPVFDAEAHGRPKPPPPA